MQPKRSMPATLLLVLELTNDVVIHEDQLIADRTFRIVNMSYALERYYSKSSL
jgi:hypothetical protein